MFGFSLFDLELRRLVGLGRRVFDSVVGFFGDVASGVDFRVSDGFFDGVFRVYGSVYRFVVFGGFDAVDHVALRSFLVDSSYLVVFVLFASESAIRFALDMGDRVCLYVHSLGKCFGCGGKFGGFLFGVLKRFVSGVELGDSVLEGGSALIYFERAVLLDRISRELWSDFVRLGVRSSPRFLCRYLRWVWRLVVGGSGEVLINDALIRLLRFLGFRVFGFSNTSGHADIVVGFPFPLIVEVKKGRAVERDLGQVLRYVKLYRYAHDRTRHLDLDWRLVLVARDFSRGLQLLAESEGVSLFTFREFFRLVVLWSVLGLTPSMLRRILVGGRVSDRLDEVYRERVRAISSFKSGQDWSSILLLEDGGRPNPFFALYGSRLIRLVEGVINNGGFPKCIKA